MSFLDDIFKMIDDSGEFSDEEKRQLKKECQAAYDMEMGGAE
jgi:hypothetical protein